MNKYIDAEWIRDVYADFKDYEGRDDWTTPITNVLAVIDDAPSIDIVRCKECKLSGTEDCPMDEIDDEYFCNFGEREGE